jgi:hypothetical protein
MSKDMGASAVADQALVSDGAASVSTLSGFDPSRVLLSLGYFEGPSDAPDYDPGPDALCPACNLPMGELNAETTLARSLWVTNGRSHFFYYHVQCAETGKAMIDAFEAAAVDQIIAQESEQ